MVAGAYVDAMTGKDEVLAAFEVLAGGPAGWTSHSREVLAQVRVPSSLCKDNRIRAAT
jgi:hypothetical protein